MTISKALLTSPCHSGIIMVGVIVGSKKTGINPDNVATPIAASFGDLITLAILAWISQGLYKCLGRWITTFTITDRVHGPSCVSVMFRFPYLLLPWLHQLFQPIMQLDGLSLLHTINNIILQRYMQVIFHMLFTNMLPFLKSDTSFG